MKWVNANPELFRNNCNSQGGGIMLSVRESTASKLLGAEKSPFEHFKWKYF